MQLKFICALLLTLLILAAQAAKPKHASVGMFGEKEKPLAITYSQDYKKTFILTKNKVYQLCRDNVELLYESNTDLYSVFATDSTIWMGTDNGVWIMSFKNRKKTFLKIDTSIANYKVVTIFKNTDQNIYVGTDAFGLYQYKTNAAPEKVSTMFPINKGISTADSTIWVGTDVGLFRNRKDAWIRYNEEGVSNFEIPDNIVENLIVDNTGLLWILMRNGLAVIETPQQEKKNNKHAHEDEHGHIPSTEYLGRSQNTIYDIHYYKNKGYLFSTEMGLLYLPTHKDEEVLENFHHGNEEKVENKALLKMPDTAAINKEYGKILFISVHGQSNYLICEKGIYKLSKNTLRKMLL